MGISSTFLKFIAPAFVELASRESKILTIGRQLVTASEGEQSAFTAHCGLSQQHTVRPSIGYLDELISLAQPTMNVESVDYMDYEGCTHVADLNVTFPKKLQSLSLIHI